MAAAVAMRIAVAAAMKRRRKRRVLLRRPPAAVRGRRWSRLQLGQLHPPQLPQWLQLRRSPQLPRQLRLTCQPSRPAAPTAVAAASRRAAAAAAAAARRARLLMVKTAAIAATAAAARMRPLHRSRRNLQLWKLLRRRRLRARPAATPLQTLPPVAAAQPAAAAHQTARRPWSATSQLRMCAASWCSARRR